MKRTLLAMTIFATYATVDAQSANATSEAALARLRSLAGEWKGTYVWTGGRTGPAGASYHLSGNGSAVIEDLLIDGEPSMASVYHADGNDLRMTHYCAAQNQPRLKAERIDLAKGQFDFAFVDATNLRSPDAPHVHAMKMALGDPDHLVITFRFDSGNKSSEERITLHRAK